MQLLRTLDLGLPEPQQHVAAADARFGRRPVADRGDDHAAAVEPELSALLAGEVGDGHAEAAALFAGRVGGFRRAVVGELGDLGGQRLLAAVPQDLDLRAAADRRVADERRQVGRVVDRVTVEL